FAGQRAPYAPPGAEAGGVAQSSIPRPPAHVRNPGTPERGGHQDGVRDAGTLQRRVHFGHLRPRYDSSPERGGKNYGKSPDGGTVNIKKSLPKEREPGGKNTASGHVFSPVWVTVWVTPV